MRVLALLVLLTIFSTASAQECKQSETDVIATDCNCAAAGNCAAGKFCYDDGCQDAAKATPVVPPAPATPTNCQQSETDVIANDCTCDAAGTCAAGKFCYDNGCEDAAKGPVTCPTREVAKEAFWSAKLEGQWDSATKKMKIILPVPKDVELKTIAWNNAQDTAKLAYDVAAPGLWTVDNSDQCDNDYILDIDQTEFFGPGSRFTLDGKQMTTSLEVHATEAIKQNIEGFEYNYEREVTNAVPLQVNLVLEQTVNAHFKTRFTPETEIELDAQLSTVTDKDDLLAKCNTVYGPQGVTCDSVREGPLNADGNGSNGNVVIEFGGDQSAVNAVFKDMEDNMFLADIYGPWPVVDQGLTHDEFVLLLSAKDDYAISGVQTVTMKMEVHSRSCVDHSAADQGAHVETSSEAKIDTNVAPTTFVWEMDTADPTKVASKVENNLCVETVTWTFAPAGYEDQNYNIGVEFALLHGLGSFVADVTMSIKQADVLGDIGFTTDLKLYTDDKATTESSSFDLGQTFFAKIDLSDLIVNTETITCSSMKIEQTKAGVTTETDMITDPIYNFAETSPGLNSIMCSAELSTKGTEQFHISVDGYDTDLIVGLTVTYVQGAQLDVRLRRRLQRYDMKGLELQVGGPRPAEEITVSTDMKINAPESYVAAFVNAIQNQSFFGRTCFGLTIVAGAFMTYSYLKSDKTPEYEPLLEI
jgi:hypothetical protein